METGSSLCRATNRLSAVLRLILARLAFQPLAVILFVVAHVCSAGWGKKADESELVGVGGTVWRAALLLGTAWPCPADAGFIVSVLRGNTCSGTQVPRRHGPYKPDRGAARRRLRQGR